MKADQRQITAKVFKKLSNDLRLISSLCERNSAYFKIFL